MLIIGDIHINTKIQDKLIQQLDDFVTSFPTENNLIFCGDYVYHFIYDRKALLALFDFWLKLYQQGKNLYIMSGNHDRLGDIFVYSQAEKLLTNFQFQSQSNIWRFIINPEIINIEGENILFLPYFYQKSWLEDQINKFSLSTNSLVNYSEFEELKKSNNKAESFSGYLNQYLANTISQYPKLFIFHHYYFAHTGFPGQKNQFSYKDTAISSQFLGLKDYYFISGHLHNSFTYQNYFCTGSTYTTSILEQDQIKFVFQFSPINLNIQASPIYLNPWIHMSKNFNNGEIISHHQIQAKFDNILEDQKKLFQGGLFQVNVSTNKEYHLNDINLLISTDEIDYANLNKYMEKNLVDNLADFKFKKIGGEVDELVEKLDLTSSNMEKSFSDWKSLLRNYITHKYNTSSHTYLDKIQEWKIF